MRASLRVRAPGSHVLSSPSPRLTPVPSLRETSLESPAPVRAVANAIAQYVDKLGVVWVEGQVAQLSRRQGLATVFLTLRDAVADLSISVTCSRTLFDGAQPAGRRGRQHRGAGQAVVLRHPRHPLPPGPRHPHGRARRAAGPDRAPPAAARRRGALRARAEAAAAVPARRRRAGHRARVRRRARRGRELPPALALGRGPGGRAPACRAATARSRWSRRCAASTRTRPST